MKTLFPSLLLLCAGLFFVACEKSDDDTPTIATPPTYHFERAGQSTVSFSGQTTRIAMGTELINGLMDFAGATEPSLLEMYRNETNTGQDASPFTADDLNNSGKSIKSKVAASQDFFSANSVDAMAIKAQFEYWIGQQFQEVFPHENTLAEAGVAGQIADGSSVRYVSATGLEYNQLVNKGLIGALMVDQMLNNYLSPAVLDAANNREENDAAVVADGKPYTTMEHKWDEAFGYAYGQSADPTDPNATIGADDSFLNEYIGKVNDDPDFNEIADDIFSAFKLGRAAIVAGDYTLRDEQAAIIRERISEVIAVRAVHYLQQAKQALLQTPSKFGSAFHDLSEAYGFIYSLQFTRMPDAAAPYFSKSEVDALLTDLLADGEHGLWTVQPATLDGMANDIADRFDFSVAEAAN